MTRPHRTVWRVDVPDSLPGAVRLTVTVDTDAASIVALIEAAARAYGVQLERVEERSSK